MSPLSHFFWGDARKAAEPESIRQPAQRRRKKRKRLEGLACINSKKWDKGAFTTDRSRRNSIGCCQKESAWR